MFYCLIILGTLLGTVALIAVAGKIEGCGGIILGFAAFIAVLWLFSSFAEPYRPAPTAEESNDARRRAWSEARKDRDFAIEHMNSALQKNEVVEGTMWGDKMQQAQRRMEENKDWKP